MGSLLRIAVRNVVRNRRRSLITFFAVFLALGVMVGVRGFLNGLQGSIRQAIIFGQTGALQIHKKGFLKSVSASLETDVPADQAFLAKITAIPHVKAVTPRIAFGGMANAHDSTSFALFSAIDPVYEMKVCPQRADMISSGKMLADSGPDSGILARELAASIGVKVGDKATILTNDKDGVMNAADFDFVGAYGQVGLPLPEKKVGFVPLLFAQKLLRMEGRATELAVAIDDIDDAERMKPILQAAVGPEYEVSTWHDVAAFIDDIIANQNFILSLLAAIFLFVALLGIANTMLMSVFERTREIGTMMAVGVRRRQILGLFLLEAGLLGLGGGIFGVGAGGGFVLWYAKKGISLQFAAMERPIHIYPHISVGYVIGVLAVAALGATLAALWPSLRASRLRPVEALGAV